MPAHRPEYLAAALRVGRALVRNPFNAAQEKSVSLAPEDVDGVVLWSKDPRALLTSPLREALLPYAWYLQYTLNGYGVDLEPGVPALNQRLDAFRRLVDTYGPEYVRWRYDPIALTPVYTPARHMEIFEHIARLLAGYTDVCTISFLDVYRRILGAMRALSMRPPHEEESLGIARGLCDISRAYDIALFTCAEPGDYSDLGIAPARCVDAQRLMRIAGREFPSQKDANQRPHCGCARSVDIGRYAACPHRCAYCYAYRPGQTETMA